MSVPGKIARYFKDADFRLHVNSKLGLYDNTPDEKFIKKLFKANTGYELNLDAPRTFNEKMQWLKLYDHRPEYTVMVDKYLARQYIRERLGEEYLIPLIGVWDNPDEIDFDKLPDQFVLKCNHTSGSGLSICRNKAEYDEKEERKELWSAFRTDYYSRYREWPYKGVPKKIICEKLLTDSSSEDGIKDYKFFCFSGVPRFLYVATDSTNGNEHETFLDMDWKPTGFRRIEFPEHPIVPEKPENFEKMKEIAVKLSQNIPFIRVDFYEVEGKMYMGELTLFPGAGFMNLTPSEYNTILGDWIVLPEKRI